MKREEYPTYQIIRTENFIETTQQLKKFYPRVTELIEAVDWALARKPHDFTQIISDYYLWVSDKLASDEFPTFKVLYKIDEEDKKVILLDIEET